MRGEFCHLNSGLIVPNTFTDEGEASFLKMIAQAAVADVSSGGNFFFGLMEDSVGDTKTLANITGEPGLVNGYARQPITRNAAGWPTTSSVNGMAFIQSATFTFTPSGGDFDKAISRLFLTNVVSGTVGLLLSIGSALAAPLTITLAGGAQSFTYRLYLR